jgi:hypothetical protein
MLNKKTREKNIKILEQRILNKILRNEQNSQVEEIVFPSGFKSSKNSEVDEIVYPSGFKKGEVKEDDPGKPKRPGKKKQDGDQGTDEGDPVRPKPKKDEQTGTNIQDAVTGLLNGIVQVLTDVTVKVVGGVTRIAGQVVNEVSNLGGQTFEEFAKAVEAAGGKAYQWGGKVWSTITSGGGGTQGSGSAVTGLPSWAANYKCIKQTLQPIGQGDNIVIAYGSETYTLSSDGKAVNNRTGSVGTFECQTPDFMLIKLSKSSGSGSSGSGSASSGSGGSCDPKSFPTCAQQYQWNENPCSYVGYAESTDKKRYSVRYLKETAIGSDGIEAYRCIVSEEGSARSSNATYSCYGGTTKIISDFGDLIGVQVTPRRAKSTNDYAAVLQKMKTIKDLFYLGEDEQTVVGVNESWLNQLLTDFKFWVKNGWRGLAFGQIINFLRTTERMLNIEDPESAELITAALKEINNIAQNYKQQDFDPNYDLQTNPADEEQATGNYESKPIKLLNTNASDFPIWRNKAFKNKSQTSGKVSSEFQKMTSEGLNEKDCEERLILWLGKHNLGSKVGLKTTGAYGGSDLTLEDLESDICRCNRNQMYNKGFMKGNRKYNDAINLLVKLPDTDPAQIKC